MRIGSIMPRLRGGDQRESRLLYSPNDCRLLSGFPASRLHRRIRLLLSKTTSITFDSKWPLSKRDGDGSCLGEQQANTTMQ
eukprot:350454-Prorocentrum_minimum.AAC.1